MFPCKDCNDTFGSKSSLARHRKTNHPGLLKTIKNTLKLCSMEDCSDKFDSRDKLINHLIVIHKVTVDTQSLKFFSETGKTFFDLYYSF